LGVVNLFLETVEISNKDRGDSGVKMRAETQIIGRGMKVKKGEATNIGQLSHPVQWLEGETGWP
jgi:hypothetical protein